MEKAYKEKRVRAIGISNYNAKQLQTLYDAAEVKPHNLQIELTVVFQQKALVNLCKKLGIVVTSYGTLGSPGSEEFRHGTPAGGSSLENPLVMELAEKYGRPPSHVNNINLQILGCKLNSRFSLHKKHNAKFKKQKRNLLFYLFTTQLSDLTPLPAIADELKSSSKPISDSSSLFHAKENFRNSKIHKRETTQREYRKSKLQTFGCGFGSIRGGRQRNSYIQIRFCHESSLVSMARVGRLNCSTFSF